MNKRLALGIATAAIALSVFPPSPALAEPEPAPAPPPGPITTAPAQPGTDVESMLGHCTQQLPEDQRSPATESMRQMMTENMADHPMGAATMGEG
jgi:hypothetical protein